MVLTGHMHCYEVCGGTGVAVCAQRVADAAALQRTYPTYNGTVVGPTGSNVGSERPTAAFCPHDGRRAELHRARGAHLYRSGHRRYREGSAMLVVGPTPPACPPCAGALIFEKWVTPQPVWSANRMQVRPCACCRLVCGLQAGDAQAYGFGTMQFSTVAGSANPSRLHYQVRGDGGGHGDAPTRVRAVHEQRRGG